jgi:FkbM family methyltransferase
MNPISIDLDPYLAQPSPLEPVLLDLLRRQAAPVIFDVGACEGEDSIRYARLFPHARIFAFEPLPGNQLLIRQNLARYAVTNVELVPLAVSDRRGEATFHVSSGRPPDLFAGEAWNYGNKSSSLLAPAGPEPMFGWLEFKEAITVQCTSLDEFCAERGLAHVDFIHLDVQGAEYLVLTGAARMLPAIGALWLEVANQELYRGQKLRADTEALLGAREFALAFGEDRGAEGDQFYVNLRSRDHRRWLARRRAHMARLRARGALAGMLRRMGLYHPLSDLRRDFRLWRRGRREIAEWQRAGRPAPPPAAVKHACLREQARRHGLRILVETGTFYGDTLFRLRRDFSQLFSIELDPALHQEAGRKLGHLGHIRLSHGSSASQLAPLVAGLEEPALFWLDAHFSAGPTARGPKETPIEEEMLILLRRPPGQNAVLIDDARLFAGTQDYPSLERLRSLIAEHRPDAQIEVRDDIIRVYPV